MKLTALLFAGVLISGSAFAATPHLGSGNGALTRMLPFNSRTFAYLALGPELKGVSANLKTTLSTVKNGSLKASLGSLQDGLSIISVTKYVDGFKNLGKLHIVRSGGNVVVSSARTPLVVH